MPTLLLIEDNDLFRDTLADALAKHGYKVIQAPDGEQGVRLFRAAPADLVITDMVMPNKEGLETVADLRREDPTVGIIAMSGGLAHSASLYLKLAGAYGAIRTLRKPFALAALLTAIQEVLVETGRDQPKP